VNGIECQPAVKNQRERKWERNRKKKEKRNKTNNSKVSKRNRKGQWLPHHSTFPHSSLHNPFFSKEEEEEEEEEEKEMK
jgi:hypothetical protein